MNSEHADRLTEFGIPVDAVEGVVGEMLEDRLSKLGQVMAAIDQANRDPRFRQEAQAISEHITADPERNARYNRIAEVDAAAAIQWAAADFRQQNGRPVGPPAPTSAAGTPPGWGQQQVHAADADRQNLKAYLKEQFHRRIHHPDLDT